jgi:DNA repair photolyase
MSTIYEPAGKAREYSPLALNLYKGCDHSCGYCYVNNIRGLETKSGIVTERADIIGQLKKDAKKFAGTDKQVLLSFTGDPYCKFNDTARLTRQALIILLENRIPVSILTKGGKRCLQDLDLFLKFGDHIKVGATLTFTDEDFRKSAQPGAAPTIDRLEALAALHDAGVRTWASLEPVVIEDQSLQLIDLARLFVDEFRVGKLNHLTTNVYWRGFGEKAVAQVRGYRKKLYVKNDLRAQMTGFDFRPEETDADRNLAVPFGQIEELELA